ncbi:hypothetical protein OK074_7180 [Actinobacteria bacterium OK074]|nr:hypothetical protein OK074_7180 [Actinobacteria bacterium OK074]
MEVAIRVPKRNFFAGKSYLAKAKAAGESKKRTSAVPVTATTTVLNSDVKNAMRWITCSMLCSRWVPGTSRGGWARISGVVMEAITTSQ